MIDPLRPHHLTLEDLDALAIFAAEGSLTVRSGTRLLEYALHLRGMIDGIYDYVLPTIGTGPLRAELELEVLAIREERRRKQAH